MREGKRRDAGFTLVEILIAIVLVGILSVVVIVGISNLTESGSSAACKASQDAANTGSRAFLASTGSYPKFLSDLTAEPKPALQLPTGYAIGVSQMSATVNGWRLTMTAAAGAAAPTFACGKATDAEISAPVPDNGTKPCPGFYTGWVGEYYSTTSPTGAATLCRDDAAINFNWVYGSPDVTVPIDTFSVRWTRTVAFTAGSHVFTIGRDDGARLYIDGALVFDYWGDTGIRYQTVTQSLTAGTHTIVLEYYENGGVAQASLSWTPA
jgi:prepilin-type N-terminal cleavage/methylation domain-containing protein